MSLNQLKNVVLPWYRPAPIPPVQKGRVQSCISLISKYWKKWWNPTQEAVAKDNIQAHQDKNTINVQIPSWIARKRVKIVIIGVHGWFPIKLLQRFTGEPIGTSQHFALKMKKAVERYFADCGIELEPDQVSMIPLEGEGKIFDRVEMLYQQLQKSLELVRQADIIVIAAHSQGCPVSTLIMEKMLKECEIDPLRQMTAILAMAGISHGPFPHLKSSVIIKYVETSQAKELFDFNNPTSSVSVAYMNALDYILHSGTKYIAVGSWYDQVVPLYSATVQGINHPNLYRALYIDAQDYQPDFLSHLLVFCLKLRNRGLSDYGIVIHLSDIVAGNIYGFGTQGHSAIYEEELTYLLGITWLFAHVDSCIPLCKDQQIVEEPRSVGSFVAPSRLNPYSLPWLMAHLMLDQNITQDEELRQDVELIKMLYGTWKPSDSVSKDVKFRLEGLKSKL